MQFAEKIELNEKKVHVCVCTLFAVAASAPNEASLLVQRAKAQGEESQKP